MTTRVNRDDMMVSTGTAAAMIGVSQKTIVSWCDATTLPCTVLPSGHRRIRIGDLLALGKAETNDAA